MPERGARSGFDDGRGESLMYVWLDREQLDALDRLIRVDVTGAYIVGVEIVKTGGKTPVAIFTMASGKSAEFFHLGWQTLGHRAVSDPLITSRMRIGQLARYLEKERPEGAGT